MCRGDSGRDPGRPFQTQPFSARPTLCLQLTGTGMYALWDQADADPAAFWAAFLAAGNSRLAQAYRVQRVRRHEYHISYYLTLPHSSFPHPIN